MVRSMQLVLFSVLLLTAQAGFWSGTSGFLSMRIPDTYDLDLRKSVRKDLHEVRPVTSAVQRVPPAVTGRHTEHSIVKPKSSSANANHSEKLMNSTPTKDTVAEVRVQRNQRRKSSAEANLINSLRHMGEKGEEAVVCVTTCRFGETVRHEWRECLERCVENPLMRSTFLTMLPDEDHKAHAASVAIPEILQEKLKHKRQRSAEL
mmetsp:Transcript_22265/g.42526  ORF Transcript_22265/g.42526 Transcript_22265/m.42526 type:complete len:205 (+) Transcript_22265:66-680(+)